MIEFWYSALNSPHGIALETDDPVRCKAKLYAARKKSVDPALSGLSVVVPPTEGELWIVKKDRPDEG